jgi:hypothetical protein
MRDSALYVATKVCWEHDIYVVVVPVYNKKYRLAISRNGREKLGEQIYGDKEVTKTIEVEKYNKVQKHEIIIPSVHKKIEQLYLHLYETNFKGMMPQPIESNNNLNQESA